MVVKLCTECQVVIDNWAVLDSSNKWVHYHHHRIGALEASAKGGCQLCRLFLAGFSNDAIRGLREEPVGSEMSATISKYEWTQDEYRLEGQYTSSASDRIASSLDVKLAKVQDCPNQQEVWPSTGCYQSLDLAKSWFISCTESHPACLVQTPEEFDHPTRLLSIGSGVLRLVLASEIKYRATYATLSHCWGNWVPLKLVKDNLTNFRIGISDSELCKTFKDAIVIAKNLGLNYIWIDSLCIIQDDPEDWRRESAKMSSVYSCSTINIAATSAEDGTMGCFFTGVCKIRLPIPMREESRLWEFSLSDPFKKFIGEPLLFRAWVFQERYLAPRTLHFTSSQIFWECKGGHRCGMFPEKIFKHPFQPNSFPKAVQKVAEIWRYAINLYSMGRLTHATDRLVAISGVARWLQAQTKDDYLAGMWREDLERQLCWRVAKHDADSPFLSRPKAYLAPSWSWASILSHVEYRNDVYNHGNTEIEVRILSAHTVLEDENCRFGKVNSGVLRLEVRYIVCGVERTTNLERQIGSIYSPSGHLLLDRQSIVWDCPKDPRNWLYLLTVISFPFYDDEDIDSPSMRMMKHGTSLMRTLDGIILEATDKPKRGEYRRVGYYRNANEYPLGNDDESLYEEVEENGKKRRVINIV